MNPLEPSYQLPGATEFHEFDMFGEMGCSMAKSNYQSRLEVQKEKLKSKLNAPVQNQNINPNVPALAVAVPVKSGSQKELVHTPTKTDSKKPPSMFSRISQKLSGGKDKPPSAAAGSEKSRPVTAAISNGSRKQNSFVMRSRLGSGSQHKMSTA